MPCLLAFAVVAFSHTDDDVDDDAIPGCLWQERRWRAIRGSRAAHTDDGDDDDDDAIIRRLRQERRWSTSSRRAIRGFRAASRLGACHRALGADAA